MSSSFSNPSTTAHSIFSFAVSQPSEAELSLSDISLFDASSLGKHGQDAGEFRAPSKRRRVTGRPKNNWTSTRLRKLTRLYLLTDLDVVDIIKVLEAEDFAPCQRDVQKRLAILLQPRPDKIRLKGGFTKRRLQQQRDCRRSQKSKRLVKPHCNNSSIPRFSSSIDEVVDNLNWEELAFAQDDSISDSISPDRPLASEVQDVNLYDFNFKDAFNIQEKSPTIYDTEERPFRELHKYHPHYRSSESQVNRHTVQGASIAGEASGAKFNLSLPEFGDLSVPANVPRPSRSAFPSEAEQGDVIAPEIVSSYEYRVSPSDYLLSCRENTSSSVEYHHSRPAAAPIAKVNSGFLREELESENVLFTEAGSYPQARVQNEHQQVIFEAKSISSMGESSCHSRSLDSRSIRRRLSLKYTRSLVDDVVTILQHLTVSGSSALSSRRGEKRLSKVLISSPNQIFDGKLSPSPPDPDFISPSIVQSAEFLYGASPGYCWEQITPKALRRSNCLLQHKAQTGQISGHGLSVAIRANVLSSIVESMNKTQDFGYRDAFGNSALHIAAALSKLQELESLINLGADINSVNNAGQTFLHLAAKSLTEDSKGIRILLRISKAHGFDFRQLDHLGQSVSHLLTRPWISPHTLDIVIAILHDLRIDPTASRDCLGWTVVEQLNHFNSKGLKYDPAREAAILSLTCEKAGHITNQTRLHEHLDRIESNKYDELSTHNFKSPTMIETLTDLEKYTYHTELLRTINKAMTLPWFEDSTGRNGLHCLAEVSLSLPGHLSSTQDYNSRTDQRPPREKYLDGLIDAGVDPNNYDKNGNTPLMAFITHTRIDEDGELTTRLLQKLLKAGADLHWRNRRGETALHIAVKLGHRAATALLLQRNANVHARTSNGKGVLALGKDTCREVRDDVSLYAQIELCMSLAIDAGAVSTPAVLQEWNCN